MDITTPPAPSPDHGRRSNVLKGAILFTLLGPPTGLFFILLGLGAFKMQDNLIEELLLVLLMSWIGGAIPAAITGVVAGLIRPRFGRLEGAGLMALAGGCIPALLVLVIAAVTSLVDGKDIRWLDAASVMGLLAIAGSIAGAVCGGLFFGTRRAAADASAG